MIADAQNTAEISRFPDSWTTWHMKAALGRAIGTPDAQMARELKKDRATIAGFLSTPEAAEIVRDIRRDAAGKMYGSAIELAPLAMDALRELLNSDSESIRLQAINTVRLIVDGAMNADGASALRELKALLKGGG